MSDAGSVILSRQNPRVQSAARLRERSARRENGTFLIEGFREISRAIAAGVIPSELFFCPEFFKNAGARPLLQTAKTAGVTLQELGESAFEKISGREGADGLIAVAKQWAVSLQNLRLPENPLLLVVEAVEKPGNLGALFRTADSAGCDALICCDAVADIFNPSVIRASQGAVFSMPCAVAPTPDVAEFLSAKKIRIFATTPAAEKFYWDADFRGAGAILLGSEKDGLSDFWLKKNGTDGENFTGAIEQISIPQHGLSDSLNVGIAGAITLFEALRQRRENGKII